MPPLITTRFKRPARGLLAITAVLAGALGGPVGPAGAGAPAGHTGALTGTIKYHSASTLTPSTTSPSTTSSSTDLLGTHAGTALTPLGSKRNPLASRAGECDPGLYGTAFYTRLGYTWTALVSRAKPCTGAQQIDYYGTLNTILVLQETQGEFICRGRTYGYGSSIWFRTSLGYIWSGGTANPRWNRAC